MSQNRPLVHEGIYTNLQKPHFRGRVIMRQEAGFDKARALFYS